VSSVNEHLWITNELARRFGGFGELKEIYGLAERELDAIDNDISMAVGDDRIGKGFRNVQLPGHNGLRAFLKQFGKAMGLTGDAGQDIAHGFDLSEEDAGSQASGWPTDSRR
jgi:hypothetical protein